ncbi:MAG: caspase family protein [Rhodocyclaceae bacterium]|nr:caspase family protein [Rhodocyclaceae bacterium]
MMRHLVFLLFFAAQSIWAQFPPMFMGGPPGFAQFQAMVLQRHQARTLLYREALEELRKNPKAADVPLCPAGVKPKAGECLLPPVAAAPPAVEKPAAAPVEEKAPASAVPPAPTFVGRRIALLVGNNAYPPPIPALETPIADVTRIASVLKGRFGYEVELLKDAGKEAIIAALNRLATQARPEDAVLIFYAGHGYEMDDTKMGYWIPIDASVKTAKGWISNDDIARLLAAIPARQIILVSDSCFSGTLAREKKFTRPASTRPEELFHRRSVVVLTSGDEEPVSDEGKEGHSIFAWNLIRALEAAGGITPGYEVWRDVHRGVTKEYPQTPQYGAVVSAGHMDGGEYLFRLEKR